MRVKDLTISHFLVCFCRKEIVVLRSLFVSSLLLLTCSHANAGTVQCLLGRVRDVLATHRPPIAVSSDLVRSDISSVPKVPPPEVSVFEVLKPASPVRDGVSRREAKKNSYASAAPTKDAEATAPVGIEGSQKGSPGLKGDPYHPDEVEKRQEAFAKEYGSQEAIQARPVREFVGANHKNYYRSWYESLDHSVQKRIDVKIERVKAGDLNGMKLVRAGVWELRFFDIGGGVRIFFTQEGKDVVLLTAGNKGTQDKDIDLAEKLYTELHRAKSP